MSKNAFKKYLLIEYVKGEEKIGREKTGEVIVYDDFSTEWEYDGKHYPHVRETIARWEKNGEQTVVSGGGSIANGEEEMVERKLTVAHMAHFLRNRLKKDGDDWEDFLFVSEKDV